MCSFMKVCTNNMLLLRKIKQAKLLMYCTHAIKFEVLLYSAAIVQLEKQCLYQDCLT